MPPPTYVPNRSTATARLGWETKSSESLGWYALTALASDNASADTRPGAGFWMVAPIPVPTPERSSGGSIAADLGSGVTGPPSSVWMSSIAWMAIDDIHTLE